MFAGLRVGAGQEDPPVGIIRPRCPNLLTGDYELVPVPDGPGVQPGQVAARPRFGKQLAPVFPAGQHRLQKPFLLLRCAVRQNSGARPADPDHVGRGGGPGPHQLLGHHPLVKQGQPPAPVTGRPVGGDQPGFLQFGVPRPQRGAGGGGEVSRLRRVASGIPFPVQKLPHLPPKLLQFGGNRVGAHRGLLLIADLPHPTGSAESRLSRRRPGRAVPSPSDGFARSYRW